VSCHLSVLMLASLALVLASALQALGVCCLPQIIMATVGGELAAMWVEQNAISLRSCAIQRIIDAFMPSHNYLC
jgi:hypothetical protein